MSSVAQRTRNNPLKSIVQTVQSNHFDAVRKKWDIHYLALMNLMSIYVYQCRVFIWALYHTISMAVRFLESEHFTLSQVENFFETLSKYGLDYEWEIFCKIEN